MQRGTSDVSNGFTLAEVLITLGIIGIVAAMTLPALIAKYQKKVVHTALMKNYSILATAVQEAVSRDGIPMYWEGLYNPGWGGDTLLCENHKCDKIVKNILSGIKVIDYYDAKGKNSQWEAMTFCGSNKTYKTLNELGKVDFSTSDTRANYASALLADGSCWILYFEGSKDTDQKVKLMTIIMDVNGSGKRPNRVGSDVFYFDILNDGTVKPFVKDDCKNINNDNGRGYGCAAKIISDGKIGKDYPWKW